MSETGDPLLDKQQHIKYWQRCHKTYLPSPYTAYDSTRLTFACFTISALDLLSGPLTHTERAAIRRWVLSLQHPEGGFCGSSTHALPAQEAYKGTANIAATFFALVLLGLAADGEDEARTAFSGVDRVRLLKWLIKLQRKDGSFGQVFWDGKILGGRDMRHSYLASCIRWMLRGDVKEGDEAWVEDLNIDEMIAHINRGQVRYCYLSDAVSLTPLRHMTVEWQNRRSTNPMVWSLDSLYTRITHLSSGICILRDRCAVTFRQATRLDNTASSRRGTETGRPES
jgi:geranylgeranyl transferase type-1 subunit beta